MPHLSNVIQNLFELDNGGFIIHSLAFDASDEAEPRWKAATISFRVRPTLLQSSPTTSDQWDFDIPSSRTESTEHSRIFFDARFTGFTPLSPAKRDEEYSIECGFSSFGEELAKSSPVAF